MKTIKVKVGKLRQMIREESMANKQLIKEEVIDVKSDKVLAKKLKSVFADQVNPFDSVRFKDKTVIVKRGYFYTGGQTIEKLKDSLLEMMNKAGIKIQIVSAVNNYNTWPKDSWFEIRFMVISYT